MQAGVLVSAAAVTYTLNCLLGSSVALRLVDTRGFRWVHHALYIATCALSLLAASGAFWASPRRTARESAALLLPAAVPLAAIPYLGTHGTRHPIVALMAAPFFLASLIRSWR